MKRPLISLAAACAAFAATAASADYIRTVTVDPVTGTRIERIEPVTPMTTYSAPVVVYEERVVPRETIVVEAAPAYRVLPAPDEILLRPGYPDRSGYPDRISAMNPQTGQLIGYGLFNRAGPNDFGGGSGNG